ncbi:receptor-like protein EIX2 [Neltuma alba]|uniref:receptor-like protein EIX2 n=1 Tax=Neltuma alba TaxID=207710 RepID=UPI0010A588D7|nr:receptor-like protein EIX2 [Prosopis alba]
MGCVFNFCNALLTLLLLLHTRLSLAIDGEALKKCIEKERKALLLFKQGIYVDYGMLSTWREEDDEDCCNWKGVRCSNQTGHVQVLNLHSFAPTFLRGTINITLLSELHDLQHLDLSYNYFYPSDIPQSIGSFTNLRYLNLSYSDFVGSIPNQLGKLPNLQYIDLSNNYLDGAIPCQIGNLSMLQSLHLGGNNLVGAIPYQIGNLSMLHTLRVGGYLSNLTIANKNNGDAEWISKLSLLTNLELSYVRDVGNSQVWQHMIGKLMPKLTELRLRDCGISHVHNLLLFASPSNYSYSLVTLDLSNNNLNSSLFQWSFNFSSNLQQLYLSNCSLSSHNLYFLSSHFHFPSLIVLDLSYNNLMSVTALSFGFNLQELYLSNCSLTSNNLIFTSFNPNLSSLLHLDLSNNLLTSSTIFDWISNFTFNLHKPDLWGNSLSPSIPDGFENVMKSLEVLDLSGEIPSSIGRLVNVEAMVLSNNSLTGELPLSLANCSKLVLLDVSENKLSGPIPSWIGVSLEQLQILSLRMNHLNGSLPVHLCHLTQIRLLDISRNNLSNEVPSCLENFTVMAQEHINSSGSYHYYMTNKAGPYPYSDGLEFYITLMWKGEDYKYMRPELFLKSIDLSSNALSGEVPRELMSLLGLVSLNLSRNLLSGEIPINIGNLESLEFLDLSNNKLSGPIPPSLANIDRLSMLDLSNNHLYGKIPIGTQLQSFNASSYGGNLDLCGLPLNKMCPEDNTPPPQEANHNEEEGASLISQEFYLSMGLGFVVGFWAVVGPLLFNRTWRQAYCRFMNTLLLHTRLSLATDGEALKKCIEKERNALLLFKQGIYDDSGMVSTWRDRDDEDCCNWRGVHCSNQTGHAQILDLHSSDPLFLRGTINITLLSELHDLQHLDLSYNYFYPSDIPQSIGSFTNLRYLNLSYSDFVGSIPNQLGKLPNLQYIDLSNNYLDGAIPCQIRNLSKLQSLNLGENNLVGVIPYQLGNLSMLHTLRVGGYLSNLTIADKNNGDAEWISKLSLLTNLELSYVRDVGNSHVWQHTIGQLVPKLKELRLGGCDISHAHNLLWFASPSNYSYSLVTLDLSDNNLNSSLFQWSFNFSSNLQQLYIREIPSSIGRLVNVEAMVLSNNSLTGELPLSLANCSKLVLLDVSENKLSGPIPSWIGVSLEQLQILSLRMNHLNGSLPVHLCHLTQIRLLDISRNNLSNEVPSCLENFTVMAQEHINSSGSYHYYMTNKAGPYPYSDGLEFYITLMWKGEDYKYMRPELFLKSIDLSSNALSGEVPRELMSLLGLVSLNLSRNLLSGEIPINIGNLESLEFLDLSNNKLSGPIPPSLANIDRLSMLDLSNNHLYGKIPIGTQLQSFNASSYGGNLDLCGLPLNKMCPEDNTPPPQEANHNEEEGASLISQEFYLSMGLGLLLDFGPL